MEVTLVAEGDSRSENFISRDLFAHLDNSSRAIGQQKGLEEETAKMAQRDENWKTAAPTKPLTKEE